MMLLSTQAYLGMADLLLSVVEGNGCESPGCLMFTEMLD